MITKLTKFGAYLILIIGILFAIMLFCFAIYFGFIYPGSNQSGRIIVSTVILAVSIAFFIITLSLFETIIEAIKIEQVLDGNPKSKIQNLKSNKEATND